MCRILQIWILYILKQSSLFVAFSRQWFNDQRTDWCFCPSWHLLVGHWTKLNIAFTVSLQWWSKESHQWFLELRNSSNRSANLLPKPFVQIGSVVGGHCWPHSDIDRRGTSKPLRGQDVTSRHRTPQDVTHHIVSLSMDQGSRYFLEFRCNFWIHYNAKSSAN